MKSLFEKILLIALLVNVIFSQNRQLSSYINALYFPQGYVLESISGFGYSTATTTSISNISSANPASLFDFNKFSIGISMQLDSDIEEAWIAQIGLKRIYNDLPQSFGIVVPIWNFKIGYGFSQRYNTQIDFGQFEIRTPSQPEGTGEFYIPIHKTYVIMNSFLAAFSMHKENAVLSAGIQFSQNKLNQFKQIDRLKFSHSDNKGSWSVGIRYDDLYKYKLGILFERGLEFKKQVTISFSDDSDTNLETVGNISDSFYVVGNLPSKLHLGFTYQIFSNVQLIGNSTYVFWNNISKSYKNEIEFSGSFIHQFHRMITYSVGFHHTDRKFNDQNGVMFGYQDKFNALYLIGGLVLRLWIVEIEFTVADSHLFSGDWRKQTIGKLEFSIHL